MSTARALAPNRLYICSTCERDAPLGENERSRGQKLIDAVRDVLSHHSAGETITLRQVHCLNGCPSACNVSFRGEGKFTLRFSRLNAEDAEAVVDFAALYAASALGEIDDGAWPEGLKGKLSARTPPRARLVGG